MNPTLLPGLTDALLVVLVLLNLFCLGTSRVGALIRAVGIQGLLLGLLSFLVHRHASAWTIAVAFLTAGIKGVAIPRVLFRAMRDVRIKREIEPFIGLTTSMVLGAVGTALAIGFAERLPLRAADASSLIVPASLSTVLTGFLLLTTRLKAITLIAGYVLLENGVFVFGLLLLDAVPFFVEVGVLLDLVAGIFVMGIIVNHIQREFASIDTSHLAELRD